MTIETAETGIGSSDAPMRLLPSNVPMRLFGAPPVGLKFIDEGTDFDQRDMPKHDEMEPRTPHESRDEPTIDDQETFSGATQVKSTRSLDLTFLVDDACVPIKIQKIIGID